MTETITVIFKTDVDLSEMEKVLVQFGSERVFPDGCDEDLGRIYVLYVPKGETADIFLNFVQNKYSFLLDYAYRT